MRVLLFKELSLLLCITLLQCYPAWAMGGVWPAWPLVALHSQSQLPPSTRIAPLSVLQPDAALVRWQMRCCAWQRA